MQEQSALEIIYQVWRYCWLTHVQILSKIRDKMVEKTNKTQAQEVKSNMLLWKQVLWKKETWIYLIIEEVCKSFNYSPPYLNKCLFRQKNTNECFLEITHLFPSRVTSDVKFYGYDIWIQCMERPFRCQMSHSRPEREKVDTDLELCTASLPELPQAYGEFYTR